MDLVIKQTYKGLIPILFQYYSRALNAECKLQNSLSQVIYLPRATSSFEENSYLRCWKIEESSEAVTIDASDGGDSVMGLREGLLKNREIKTALG